MSNFYFNRNELEVALLNHNLSKKDLATYLGLNSATLYRKINNSGNFKYREIVAICDLFSYEEAQKIFFSPKVA